MKYRVIVFERGVIWHSQVTKRHHVGSYSGDEHLCHSVSSFTDFFWTIYL